MIATWYQGRGLSSPRKSLRRLVHAEKEAQIVDLCRAYHVRQWDLFGSAASDNFRPG
jgi:hypothetical protein